MAAVATRRAATVGAASVAAHSAGVYSAVATDATGTGLGGVLIDGRGIHGERHSVDEERTTKGPATDAAVSADIADETASRDTACATGASTGGVAFQGAAREREATEA